MRTSSVDRKLILELAIKILEKRGLWQSKVSYAEETKNGSLGKISVTRALRLATAELGGTEYDFWEARYAVSSVLDTDNIESWNDSGKTTYANVIEVLRKSIQVEKTWDNHMSWAWIPKVYGKKYK